ncbi:MAG: delta-60 repeat domain-containing protein [Flavobacteriia bacterium]|nr:delta-60 repeat domain-containing protein [Flavobacteriia bacterium]
MYNYIRALKRQSDGKIIVGGKFTSFNGITAGDITRIQGNIGTQAKNGSIMCVSEPEIDINSTLGNVKVYPNLRIGVLNIDLSGAEVDYSKIVLYNLLGQEV